MSKVTAICEGVDWTDASVDYLVLPEGMDIEKEQTACNKWYHETYVPALNQGQKLEYLSLVDWLLARGARRTTDEELEEYWS